MSELRLQENLLRLRRNKGITQEELARFIGVTKTSVSKWENGTTMPDIQILPMLASYFDVSLDLLLGYEPQLSKEQIGAQYHRLAKKFGECSFEEVMEESEVLVRKYYSCYLFLQYMAVLWLNHAILAPDSERTHQVYERIKEVCDHIIKESHDIGLCNNAVSIKALTLLQMGKGQEVIDLMEDKNMDVNRIEDHGMLLTMAYTMSGQMEKAELSAQIGMYQSLMELIGFGIRLLEIKQGDTKYCLEVVRRLDCLLEIFSIMGLNPNTAGVYYYQTAVFFCSILKEGGAEQEEKIYQRIACYVESIKQLFLDDINIHGDKFFSHLDGWFAQLEIGTAAVRSKKVILADVIDGLKVPVFSKLKDQRRLERYIEQLERLKEEGM